MKAALTALFLLNLYDGLMTQVAVTAGCAYEANPLMAQLIEKSWSAFWVYKLLVLGVSVWFLYLARRHFLARAGAIGALAAYSALAVYHTIAVLDVQWTRRLLWGC